MERRQSTIRLEDAIDHNGVARFFDLNVESTADMMNRSWSSTKLNVNSYPSVENDTEMRIPVNDDSIIAPWIDEPPTPPPKNSFSASTSRSFALPAKSSLPFVSLRQNSASTILRPATSTSRTSDTSPMYSSQESTHKRRSADDDESSRGMLSASSSVYSVDLRKAKSSLNLFAKLKTKASKPQLKLGQSDESEHPSLRPPLPQFPHNNHSVLHLSARNSKDKGKKVKKGSQTSKIPPSPPPKDDAGQEFTGDFNLDSMDGIVNFNLLASQPPSINPHSPSESAQSHSDHSSSYHQHNNVLLSSEFSDPFSPSASTNGTSLHDKRKAIIGDEDLRKVVSPKTIVPLPPNFNPLTAPDTALVNNAPPSSSSCSSIPIAATGPGSPTWVAPESWAVAMYDHHGTLEIIESGSDNDGSVIFNGNSRRKSEDKGRRKSRSKYPYSNSISSLASNSTSNMSPSVNGGHRSSQSRSTLRIHPLFSSINISEAFFRIRIYIQDTRAYHVVLIYMETTVANLTEKMNKVILAREQKAAQQLQQSQQPVPVQRHQQHQTTLQYNLYLKERGRERVMAQAEKPAVLLKSRMTQAGYDLEDGMYLLPAESLGTLVKFVYKSQLLGGGEPIYPDNYEAVDLTGQSLQTIPVALHQHADSIVSLKLSRNPMLEIPLDFIQSCITLRELRLTHMSMKKVPQSIRHSATLHRLDLQSNSIKDLEEALLDQIPGLLALSLQNNRLDKLPWYFPRIRSLTKLNISNNKFKDFPPALTQMENLRELDLSFNMISEIPEKIEDMKTLERLVLVGNQVSAFPEGVSGLMNLTTLDCRRNQIGYLRNVCALPKLQHLYADHNVVHALKVEMGPSMVHLNVSHNDITLLSLLPPPPSIPAVHAMGKAPLTYALTFLDVSYAKLSSLEEVSLSHLASLHTLKLDHNSIRSIPETLGSLQYLQVLSCTDNKLDAIPSSIGNLQRLEVLDVHTNSLTELPKSIWNCSKLAKINVTSNLLGSWPDPPVVTKTVVLESSSSSMTNFQDSLSVPNLNDPMYGRMRKSSTASITSTAPSTSSTVVTTSTQRNVLPPLVHSLSKLYLGENNLDDGVILPLMILKELRVLNLSFNYIQDLPPSFFRNMGHLEELYLSGNKLTSIPVEDFPRLTRLSVLFLNANKLHSLPQELGKVANLSVLDVGSNYLRYNINNWEFDWNWNFNTNLKYLNLSGNKRLQIKTDSSSSSSSLSNPGGASRTSRHIQQANHHHPHPAAPMLSGFTSLSQLRVLGLMDVTITTTAKDTAVDIPDETADRRVRTSLSTVCGMGYGIADSMGRVGDGLASGAASAAAAALGPGMTIIDLVHEFPGGIGGWSVEAGEVSAIGGGRKHNSSLSLSSNGGNGGTASGENEAIFAMFGRTHPTKGLKPGTSSNLLSKFLHDSFVNVFTAQVGVVQEKMRMEYKKDGKVSSSRKDAIEKALRWTFLKINQDLSDMTALWSPRKNSQVSIANNGELYYSKMGVSGIALYFSNRTIYAANVGDSLAVVSRQGESHLISKKHDPFDRVETYRIRSAEGSISTSGLVNEEVDVSRSFGYFNQFPPVIARPDTFIYDLTDMDEFVIIANSGLWDYMSYQTAVDIARTVATRMERPDPMLAAQKLRDFAISYGANGSTMIMVVWVADLFVDRSGGVGGGGSGGVGGGGVGPSTGAVGVGAGNGMGVVASINSMINVGTRARQPTLENIVVDPQIYRSRKKDDVRDRFIARLEDEVEPPIGHLALVFTDIRNSTHLWEANPGMPTAMRLHNNLLRRQLRFCGGYEVKTEGDSFMCSFPTTLAAVWWCLTVQVQLLHEPWPLEILECEDGKSIYDSDARLIARGLSVRMGIHSGAPLCETDLITHRMDYFGPMVNRTARINSSALGGQIMCSMDVVREINARVFEIEEEETEYSKFQSQQAVETIRRIGVVVTPVGEVKLKGIELPEILSILYPVGLEGRHDLKEETANPSSSSVSTSKVQFSVPQIEELGMLCLRIEALSSGRRFKTLLPNDERKGSIQSNPEATTPSAAAAAAFSTLSVVGTTSGEEGTGAGEESSIFFGDPNILLPRINDLSSDEELMLVLDSLSLRIDNAVNTIGQRCRDIMASLSRTSKAPATDQNDEGGLENATRAKNPVENLMGTLTQEGALDEETLEYIASILQRS